MIYHNEKSQEVLRGLTQTQWSEGVRAHEELVADLNDSGEMVAAEVLAGPLSGKQVSVKDGVAKIADGPFLEMKEHLAGFYLVDCETIDDAIAHAARIPEAKLGLVEVRPVLTEHSQDM